MLTTLLFDFDGVIADSEPLHCAALIETLAGRGIALDEPTYYAEYLGFDDRECFRYAFQQHGRDASAPAVAEAIAEKNRAFEARMRAHHALIPGAADFIRAAAADGLRLAIVSGALRREIELVLVASGLAPHFETIVPADDVMRCKPDPEGYREALRRLGVEAANAVVLEDSLPGLEAARGAGCACAMLATSHPAHELVAADLVWADFTGHRPAELRALVDAA
ncbi:MAG: HAD family phosphatase [Gemmatimonadales bacterium]|nr:HAD family phosphatase [Gemmatimonadales bacterium]